MYYEIDLHSHSTVYRSFDLIQGAVTGSKPVQAGAAWEYQLYMNLQDARQGDRSIQEFYWSLSGYWEELQIMKVLIQIPCLPPLSNSRSREIVGIFSLCHATISYV